MSRARSIVIAGTAVAVLAVAILLVAGRGDVDCDTFRFDAAAWQASRSAEGDADRAREIGKGLAECGVLTGKTASEVRRMLGAPAVAGRAWEYELGPSDAGYAEDGDFLDVSFDAGPSSGRRVSGAVVSIR